MSFRIIWRNFATIANLATNQELTLLFGEGLSGFHAGQVLLLFADNPRVGSLAL